MDTITIQLKHANAKKLLKDLEDMNIIKIIEQPIGNDKQKKPSRLRGFLSKEKANALLSHVEETRREWEERFPSK
jgi:hypothetical protein